MQKLNGDRDADITRYMPYAMNVAVAFPLSKIIGLDDAISESYYALILAYDSFEPSKGAKFETWVSLRVKWWLISYVRSQKSFLKSAANGQRQYVPATISVEDLEYYDFEDEQALEAFDMAEMAMCLKNLENILSYKQMDSFQRYYQDGCPMRELAEKDGVTTQAISDRISTAKEKIRKHVWGAEV